MYIYEAMRIAERTTQALRFLTANLPAHELDGTPQLEVFKDLRSVVDKKIR